MSTNRILTGTKGSTKDEIKASDYNPIIDNIEECKNKLKRQLTEADKKIFELQVLKEKINQQLSHLDEFPHKKLKINKISTAAYEYSESEESFDSDSSSSSESECRTNPRKTTLKL